jgi:autotransporter adhesin
MKSLFIVLILLPTLAFSDNTATGTNAIAYGFSHHDSENDIVFRLIGSRSGNVSSSAGSIGWGF